MLSISKFIADVICTCYLVSPPQKSISSLWEIPRRPFGAIILFSLRSGVGASAEISAVSVTANAARHYFLHGLIVHFALS